MDRIIRQITENYIDRLPENRQYYKLADLREWGFRRFIIDRIKVELHRNLAESLRIPKTDWANMQSEIVQDIWKQFISAIRAEAWLPASYAKTVIETAVADVLDMLVQPRKNIPDIIFGSDKELSRREIEERVEAIVVYRHFANLVIRYMEKKELETLERERCADLIRKADEKMTARYSPLNWAQMLEPLFNLMDEQIDSNLLRLFFEDRDMPRIARAFDYMEGDVNRAEFIEVLSSPDSLNLEGFEEDQSELFEGEPPEAGEQEEVTTEAEEEQARSKALDELENIDFDFEEKADKAEAGAMPPEEPVEQMEAAEEDERTDKEMKEGPEEDREEHPSEAPREEKRLKALEELRGLDLDLKDKPKREEAEKGRIDEEDDADDPITAAFHKSRESKATFHHEEDEEGDEGPSLNDRFRDEDDREEAGEVVEEQSREEDEAEEEREEMPEADETEDENEEFSLSEENIERIIDVQQEQGEETPMWQRFMSPEQLEESRRREQEAEEEDEDEGFIEEPIYDATASDEPDEDEIEQLRELLEDEREQFVKDIFRGSERAYEEATAEIAGKDDWRSASKYIEKEVFKRNLVDMYSEAAVDFTDRLQSYFLEKSDS